MSYILSVRSPHLALKRLRMEQALRSVWKTADGSLIPIREMSDERLERTIAMLERGGAEESGAKE